MKNQCKIDARKSHAKIMKNDQKGTKKGAEIHEKPGKRGPKNDAKINAEKAKSRLNFIDFLAPPFAA